ncbi:MAG: hypothetical protein JWO36_6402 [Myxococcales bacterium]|nr:hypothetical protein [Myxococcales bacterium]
MRTSTSVAILGGGASGLTLARTLVDLGFTRIVVFEREAEVGGKSCTIDIDGRPHDLGATMGVPIDYRHVQRFSREANLATTPFPIEQHYRLAEGREVSPDPRTLPRVLAQAAAYVAMHARSWRGDLHRADPQLFAPWSEVVERHGLGDASRRMLCYRTGYGYGFDDEVPAVMYASLIRPQTLLGLAVGSPFMWRTGTQPIWKALATRLSCQIEVRTATPVTRIVRDGGVVVYSRGRRERFDRLAIACDPRSVLGILDGNAAERRWFSQVRTYPYSTFACEVEGLAPGRESVGYIDDNMSRDRVGHPMAWVKRYANQDIYVFHLFAPADLRDAELTRRIAGDVERLGGRLVSVRASRRWDFFPHFPSAFMRAGGLAEIDQWQGHRHTYLIGEVLSFATMARVSEHAVGFAHRMARESTGVTATARMAS